MEFDEVDMNYDLLNPSVRCDGRPSLVETDKVTSKEYILSWTDLDMAPNNPIKSAVLQQVGSVIQRRKKTSILYESDTCKTYNMGLVCKSPRSTRWPSNL